MATTLADMATPDPDVSAAVHGVGARLRTLRERRGSTLAQVSVATGISVSTLSRLESGGRRATLELLLPLAREFRVSLDELITLPTAADPRITPVVRRDRGRVRQQLTRDHAPVQIVRTSIDPNAPDAPGAARLTAHPGFDWVYVLSGRLRLTLGERAFMLTPGQAAEFDTTVPHAFSAADARPVDYLSLFTPDGRRAHGIR